MSTTNAITVFFHERFGEIRVVDEDGNPWFLAKDVCDALEFRNHRQAIATHCSGVQKMDVATPTGIRSMSIIPESDVYMLVMRSNVPKAKGFQEWVVGEVLPSLRKTGGYQISQRDVSEWFGQMQRDTNAIVAAAVGEMANRFIEFQREFAIEHRVVVEDNRFLRRYQHKKSPMLMALLVETPHLSSSELMAQVKCGQSLAEKARKIYKFPALRTFVLEDVLVLTLAEQLLKLNKIDGGETQSRLSDAFIRGDAEVIKAIKAEIKYGKPDPDGDPEAGSDEDDEKAVIHKIS